MNKGTQQQEAHNNPTQEWPNYKKKIGVELQNIYPLSKKQNTPEEPEWVTELEQWGTEHEIRQIGHAYKKKELNYNNKLLEVTKNLAIKEPSSYYRRYYKHGSKHPNTPRNMPPRSSIPDAPSSTSQRADQTGKRK